MTSLRSAMTDVGKDRHRLVFPGSPASFFSYLRFFRRARQLRITYQLITFFNIRDKRLKLPFHNIVPCDKIKKRSTRYI